MNLQGIQLLYVTMVVLGIIMVGAEIILPGGVLGVLGGAALFGAIVIGFIAFDTNVGMLSALAIVLFSGLCIGAWVKFFPHTPMGRRLTLSKSGKDFRSSPDQDQLLGREGIAVTTLRPSGIAKIDEKRVDVVADNDWIESGQSIRVVRVEGFRVLVQAVDPQGGAKDPA